MVAAIYLKYTVLLGEKFILSDSRVRGAGCEVRGARYEVRGMKTKFKFESQKELYEVCNFVPTVFSISLRYFIGVRIAARTKNQA